MKNKAITSRGQDFPKWYTDVVMAARLANYSTVKGCVVIEPNGYALWEKMQSIIDQKFKETGHTNVYMPLLIPENLLRKEGELINGFAPEVAWVTHGGEKTLEERMCIRPTSETLFSDYYAGVVRSYRDLPKKFNQWCSVMRWEKETRPFLRSREFLWQEGHTIHETSEEAEAETKQMLNIYLDFFENYLAIPAIVGMKTDKEKFAGAEYTLTVEALMYNGVALQSATSHYFGQKFSKAYGIQFSNRLNELEYAYQTSWGCSTRMIGALIMVHSDDKGLVLPPKIAPCQVRIIPIGTSDKVKESSEKILGILKERGIVASIDFSEKSPGFKFAEAEVLGIPIRVDVGERELEENRVTLVRRDDSSKRSVSLDEDLALEIMKEMDLMQHDLYEKALRRRDEMTYTVVNLAEMEEIIKNHPGFIKAMWCGDSECENKIKEIRGIKSRCIPFESSQEHISDKCCCCGRTAQKMVIWGIQY